MSRESKQAKFLKRFRDAVFAWAEARQWPRLRDGMGFLISRSGKEEWIYLIEHVSKLSPENQVWLANRILAAMGLKPVTSTERTPKKKNKKNREKSQLHKQLTLFREVNSESDT